MIAFAGASCEVCISSIRARCSSACSGLRLVSTTLAVVNPHGCLVKALATESSGARRPSNKINRDPKRHALNHLRRRLDELDLLLGLLAKHRVELGTSPSMTVAISAWRAAVAVPSLRRAQSFPGREDQPKVGKPPAPRGGVFSIRANTRRRVRQLRTDVPGALGVQGGQPRSQPLEHRLFRQATPAPW